MRTSLNVLDNINKKKPSTTQYKSGFSLEAFEAFQAFLKKSHTDDHKENKETSSYFFEDQVNFNDIFGPSQEPKTLVTDQNAIVSPSIINEQHIQNASQTLRYGLFLEKPQNVPKKVVSSKADLFTQPIEIKTPSRRGTINALFQNIQIKHVDLSILAKNFSNFNSKKATVKHFSECLEIYYKPDVTICDILYLKNKSPLFPRVRTKKGLQELSAIAENKDKLQAEIDIISRKFGTQTLPEITKALKENLTRNNIENALISFCKNHPKSWSQKTITTKVSQYLQLSLITFNEGLSEKNISLLDLLTEILQKNNFFNGKVPLPFLSPEALCMSLYHYKKQNPKVVNQSIDDYETRFLHSLGITAGKITYPPEENAGSLIYVWKYIEYFVFNFDTKEEIESNAKKIFEDNFEKPIFWITGNETNELNKFLRKTSDVKDYMENLKYEEISKYPRYG